MANCYLLSDFLGFLGSLAWRFFVTAWQPVGPHHRPGWSPELDQGAVGDNKKDDIINHHGGDEEQALWPGLRCCRKTELEVEELRGERRGGLSSTF